MRIVVSDFISLDGVIQAPGGKEEDTDGGFQHGGWSMPFFDVDVMGAAVDEAIQTTDALLFGRRTWRVMADAWPGRAGDAFADKMNALPKYVLSRTLKDSDMEWNTTLLPAGDLVASVQSLRDQPGGDVQVMGSASVARFLTENDLVDQYRLMIEPIILGGGKKLFPEDGAARTLELVEQRTASTGVQVCVYNRVRD